MPSWRAFRDYRNAIKPKLGFNVVVITKLINVTKNYIEIQKYTALSFDKMKMRANLVYEKCSGELIGYIHFGKTEIDYSTFENANDIAIRGLVYYLRGVANYLKFCLSYFAPKGINSYKIMSTFWKGVSILKLTGGLNVIAAVSDEASAKRKFYDMHKFMDPVVGEAKSVTYRIINLSSPNRYITFLLMHHTSSKRAIVSIICAVGNVRGICRTIKSLLFRIIMFKL